MGLYRTSTRYFCPNEVKNCSIYSQNGLTIQVPVLVLAPILPLRTYKLPLILILVAEAWLLNIQFSALRLMTIKHAYEAVETHEKGGHEKMAQ